MKIGIYGGTFNPPHLGHLTAAAAVIATLKLDKLLLIPASIPPHKDLPAGSATAEQRLEMPCRGAGDLNAMLSQLTGGLDPALLSRLLPVLSQMNRQESSETSALLYALQPFLRDKRRDKVARAAQLAKLIHLAKVFLTTREE